MIRDDSSKFLLYIEPELKIKAAIPMEDEYTMILRTAMAEGKLGISNYDELGGDVEVNFRENDRWKGCHYTEDGMQSSNYDILLPNGMVTHSLAVHYLLWFRESIPASDWNKLKDLQRHYGRSIHLNK